MMRKMSSKAKRSATVALATTAAVVATLFGATPAFAYTPKCSSFHSGNLVWEVCVAQVNATAAHATVQVYGSGTYISGHLHLEATTTGGQNWQDTCSGKIYPGTTCIGGNANWGRGSYMAHWISVSGSDYHTDWLTF
jgi:hypothetical protein